MNYRVFFRIVFFIIIAQSLGAQPLIKDANELFYNFRVAEAIKIYEEVWASAKLPEVKSEAGKQLISINWQFLNDYEQSREIANEMLVLYPYDFDVPFRMAGIAIKAGKYDDAGIYLEKSLNRAGDGYQKQITYIRSAECIISNAQKVLSENRPIDTEKVRKALDNIHVYYLKEPENLNLTRLYLGLVLLLEKEDLVLSAFRAYFRIPEGEKPSGILGDAETMIKNGLRSDTVKDELARGLALARFYDYAVMTIYQFNLDLEQQGDIADICNYFNFLNETEEAVYSYFRQKSLGTVSDINYFKEYYIRCINFWEKLRWENSPPVFYEEGFEDELFKRFGAKLNTGEGGSDICFFAGHSVVYEKRNIEQYGRQSRITYTSLDYIVGNIYPHWYFRFFGVGGWATSRGEVFSIRTVNFNGNSPLRAFNRLIDEKERKTWLIGIKELSVKDDSLARIHPYELMKGLPERIKFNCYSMIIDSLKQLHDTPAELKIHFLTCMDDILVKSVVFSHEARHILDSYEDYPDNTLWYSAEEREFRANLSGLAFSPNPIITIGEGLFVPQDPAHENANRRIIKGLVEWMDLHRNEIQDLDQTRPLLPQLDLLTNNQIVRAIRSLDPLYANYVSNKN